MEPSTLPWGETRPSGPSLWGSPYTSGQRAPALWERGPLASWPPTVGERGPRTRGLWRFPWPHSEVLTNSSTMGTNDPCKELAQDPPGPREGKHLNSPSPKSLLIGSCPPISSKEDQV